MQRTPGIKQMSDFDRKNRAECQKRAEDPDSPQQTRKPDVPRVRCITSFIRRSELPAAGEAHNVLRVVLCLERLETREVSAVDALERRVEDRVVAVQSGVRDVLALRKHDLRKVCRALASRIVHGVIGEVQTPCVVDVEREEALCARGRERGGALGRVREDGGQEGLDIVADEVTGLEREALAPELWECDGQR